MGKLITRSRDILRMLAAEMPKVTEASAGRALHISNGRIPRKGASRGYATNALRNSGHIQMDTGDTGNYDKAVADAIAASDGRILRREQIDLPSVPARARDKSTARIYYPLDYASAIHDGFYHVRAKRFIIGTAFLLSAISYEENDFLDDVAKLVKKLESIQVLTAAQLKSLDNDLFTQQHNAGKTTAEREDTQEFRAATDPKLLERMPGETMAEFGMRIRAMKKAWRSVRGSDDVTRNLQDVDFSRSAGESGF